MIQLNIEQMDDEMAEIMARKTELERLQIAWGMWRSTKAMLTRIVTSENQAWTTDQVQAEVNRRMAVGA